MNPWQDAVRTFNRDVVKVGIPDNPSMLSPERAAYRLSHLDEEVQELNEAYHSGDLAGLIQEGVDVIYVLLGLYVEVGIDLDPFFAEVHAANMRKVGGKHRADGKMLKPAGWEPPDIRGVLLRQRAAA